MNNPYQAPKADLGKEIIEPKSKRGWKIFFWVLLVLQVLSVLFMWSEASPQIHELVINLLVYPFILIGLFAYAYNKRFISQGFWKVLFFIGISSDLYSVWALIKEGEGFSSDAEMYFTLVLMAVLILPMMYFQYLGLYRYGYNAPEIWEEHSQH